jgi:hypothetical protein
MIGRDVVVEAKVVKQLSRCRLNAHHRRLSRKSAGLNESRPPLHINQPQAFQRYPREAAVCSAHLNLQASIHDSRKCLTNAAVFENRRVGRFLLSGDRCPR